MGAVRVGFLKANGGERMHSWAFWLCLPSVSARVIRMDSSFVLFRGIRYRVGVSAATAIGYAAVPHGALWIPAKVGKWPVTGIGESAFFWCTQITSVRIPASIQHIGKRAFYGCSSLKSIKFASNSQLTHIHHRGFARCESLRPVTFPHSLTRIGSLSFSACNSLNTIVIPNAVERIGLGAFANCRKLQQIDVKSSNTHFRSRKGVLYRYGMRQFAAGSPRPGALRV
jgi:hypothetical protein